MKFSLKTVIFVVLATMFIVQSHARPGWLEDFGKEIVSNFYHFLKIISFKLLIIFKEGAGQRIFKAIEKVVPVANQAADAYATFKGTKTD